MNMNRLVSALFVFLLATFFQPAAGLSAIVFQQTKTSQSKTSIHQASTSQDGKPKVADHRFFEPGIRLMADGKIIKTKWFGHAAPALFDIDRDGDLDLLVGQYQDGDVSVYKNIGTDKNPKYQSGGMLMAGEKVASVPTFCCVGFTPQFIDFDGDQIVDVLSGSYPGQLYLFRGLKNGKFASGKKLLDENQKEMKPGLATTAFAADIDNDGDLDLLSSLKRGGVSVCYNEGTSEKTKYQSWEDLLANGKKIPFAHTGPVVVDFDKDGIKDLLVASEKMEQKDQWRSKIHFYRNIAKKGKPKYQKPIVVMSGHVGLRLKVFPVDYDQDGTLDLLVGDMFADCPQKEYTGFVWFFRGKKNAIRSLSNSRSVDNREHSPTNNHETLEPKSTKNDSKVHFQCNPGKGSQGRFLELTMRIEPHWHIYGPNSRDVPTRLELPKISGVKFGKPIFPAPITVQQFGEQSEQYTGNVTIKIPFQFIESKQTNMQKNRIKVHYQVCGDASVGGVCLPPSYQWVEIVAFSKK